MELRNHHRLLRFVFAYETTLNKTKVRVTAKGNKL
jgi:hypothetical protein